MENSWSWEQKAVITELIQGLQLTKQLKLSGSNISDDSKRLTVERILASFQKSLLILNQSSVPQGQPQGKKPICSLPGSPLSVNGSPLTDDNDGRFKESLPKKRKMLEQNTQQVRFTTHNGLEGPQEDGYSWRKYGQKDILGAKYPRSYYRCTYRSTQNCSATKKVQRSEEDPLTFEITYHGKHTCSQSTNSIPAPASPDKTENKLNNSIHNHQESENALSNLRASLCVDTELLAHKELEYPFSFPSKSFEHMKNQNHTPLPTTVESSKLMNSYSPCLVSPATPEPDYLLQWQTDNFLGDHNFRCAESDLMETLSAKTSNTNSPMPDMDFPLDLDEIYRNLTVQNPDFFSYFG